MADPAEEDIRAFLLPLMIPKGGTEPELAVPGILKEPYDAMQRLLSNPYQPGAGDANNQAIMDALTVGGSAGLGSIAAPRPANSLGVFGGSRMRANLERAGIDPDNTQGILTQFKDQTGGTSPYVDYTGMPLMDFDFSTAEINPIILKLLDDPYAPHGKDLGTADLGDVIDVPNFYKAMPEARNIPVMISKSVDPNLSEGGIGHYRSDPSSTVLALGVHGEPDFRAILAHEVNHLGQKFEGQEFGANIDTIPPELWNQVMYERMSLGGSALENDIDPNMEAYTRNSAEVLSRISEDRAGMTPEQQFNWHPALMEEMDIPRPLQFNNSVLEALRSSNKYLKNIKHYREKLNNVNR